MARRYRRNVRRDLFNCAMSRLPRCPAHVGQSAHEGPALPKAAFGPAGSTYGRRTRNRLKLQSARMPANTYVISREPIVGIRKKVVNSVPITLPTVEIPYTNPAVLP